MLLLQDLSLAAYIARYNLRGRLRRLISIAENYEPLRDEALRLLETEVKASSDIGLYNKVVSLLNSNLPSGYEADKAWIEDTRIKNLARLEKLDAEAVAAKNCMVKESVRLSHIDLAVFHQDTGDLAEANKYLVKARSVSTSRQTVDLAVDMAINYIEQGQVSAVASVMIGLAEGKNIDVLMSSKIAVVSAINELANRQYKTALMYLLSVSYIIESSMSQIVTCEDIIMYIAVLSLATLKRQEIRNTILQNKDLEHYLDLVPETRTLLRHYVNRDMAKFSALFEHFASHLSLDIHFSSHLERIRTEIKSSSILQYFAPYSTISLSKMSSDLCFSVSELEQDLVRLISKGDLPSCRIDIESQTLIRQSARDRDEALNKMNDLCEEHVLHAKATLLRLSFLKNGLVVTSKHLSKETEAGVDGGNKMTISRHMHESYFRPSGFRGRRGGDRPHGFLDDDDMEEAEDSN